MVVKQFPFLRSYRNCGGVSLATGFDLKRQLKPVPRLPGVYLIYRKTSSGKKLVYIGRSGTIDLLGKFGKQTLRKRLSMKQNGIKRSLFFASKILEDEAESLKIYWFVTFDDHTRDLPAYVEGRLMQGYFEKYQTLPPWNRKF